MAEQRTRRKRKKRLILQWIELLLFRFVQGLLRVLPQSFVRLLGGALGRLLFTVARSRTRLALDNLAASLPELGSEERSRMIRECWERFTVETLNYVRTIGAPADVVAESSILPDSTHLKAVLAQNRGVVLYTAHFGAWESAIAMVRLANMPFAVVARPLDNELLETLLTRSRGRFDVEMVPKRNAARTLMRRLSKGEGVLILPDQAVHPREGILVPFLGRPAWTTAAPARLALRYGSPIIGAFCYRRGGKVVAELTAPIFTADLEETAENVEMLTRRINDEISNRIRQSPELWLWMHDRWKRAGDSN
ncbi:MAG: lysophospholipid acyltransferase family protein [Acidobacteria bacterium]|nr:lysophospholipid acyltransferase family protein [Acidobacteriota bacterium]